MPSKPLVPVIANSNGEDPSEDSSTSIDIATQTTVPKMYKVILMNDDYTPMDFVILVLRRFFGKDEGEANKIMLDVHKKGSGVAGVYTLEIAEMRTMQSNQFARVNKHPLKTVLEPE